MTSSPATPAARPEPVDLSKFALLSIAAAVLTIGLKIGAYLVSGSVGLLSDAAESTVNLVAAIVAFIALKVSIKGADRSHQYGHTKAEYFSALTEGAMIFVAAMVIVATAINRFINPQPLENVGLGLIISVVASILNGTVAWVLLRAGRKHRSMTLVADGKHLLTDVWTSVGVIIGVGLVAVTKLIGLDWWWLDPLVALLVGLNIIWTGGKLLRESSMGLTDASMDRADNEQLAEVLRSMVVPGEIAFHGLRTRVAGRHRYAEVHVLVPGEWTILQGHDFAHSVEEQVNAAFDDLYLTAHIEPIEDPKSYEDIPVAQIPVHDEAGAPPRPIGRPSAPPMS